MAKNDESFEEPILEEAGLLTAAEIEKIKLEARASIITAKKAEAKKKLLADEIQRLRVEDGLTTGNSYLDEIVSITIDLAPYAPHILVNGVAYWHGRTYPVARHVAASLQETMFNTWKHQSTIRGESLNEFYAKKHVEDLYKVGGTTSLKTLSARNA